MIPNSSIKCNCYYTICISNEFNVFSCGLSEYGSHGHKENQINIPIQINDLINIQMINCSKYYCVCLTFNGDVYSFGKLGNELEQTHIPQKINLPPCKQVECGNNFTMCLTECNNVYSFGYNSHGQLGLGNNNNYSSPQLIPDFNNIEYIVCGGFHCICKTYNNEFYSWGNNYNGQLGQGANKSCNKLIQCINWPDNIINIKCGNIHSLLLTLEGHVYPFGSNRFGQLGINNRYITSKYKPTSIKDIPEIQRIECGYSHSMCIDINNNLWLFGNNICGQLGLGDIKNKYKPIIHPSLSNIIDISSGGYHTFVKTIDNKIYAFGNNKYSQLGIKTKDEYQLTPIQVFKDNEDIWCSTIGISRAKSARK